MTEPAAAATSNGLARAAPPHGVRLRIGATLVATVTRSGLSFFTGLLIARGLGPAAYGDLGFLLAAFVAWASILEMGTSSAFYTFLAQRRRSRSFLGYYTAWMALQFVVPATALVFLPDRVLSWIWVNESRRLVLLALTSSFLLNQAWGMLTQLAEARRLTVLIQVVTVAQAAVHLVLIALAFYFHWLAVSTVLIFTGAEYAVCILVMLPRLTRENVDHHAESDSLWDTLAEFAGYCQPLVVIGWVGFAHAFLERWLLQRYGGSAQQGFFTVANQFATIGGILTVSVVKVLWKEIAEATEHRNEARVKGLYNAATRGLFFAIAWICCLLMPYARDILGWTVGPAFTGATLSFTLMLAYPIHQAVSQTQSTLLYASGETRLYSRFGLWGMAASIPATYFALAPRTAFVPGLGWGAAGLALKMVGLQVAVVSVQAWIIARRRGWRAQLGLQAIVLPSLAAAAWACREAAHALAALAIASPPPWLTMAIGTTLYAGATLLLAVRFPTMTGLNRLRPTRSVRVMAPTP
jgi:O-antigen/teichoic acid export membrane protein